MSRLGIIGRPLSHSFSPTYFDKKFRQLRRNDLSYELFELERVEDVKHILEQDDVMGFNVTIPYKSQIIAYLDRCSSESRSIGAVNCVVRTISGWEGHNTDYLGFKYALSDFLSGAEINKALILGSGGSAKAVAYALKELDIAYSIVSRSGELTYDNLHASHIREAELIINTTPLGMAPLINEYPSIPYEAIGSRHFAFDLIYNPDETAFLKKCRILGAKTTNGLQMLSFQAEASWDLWAEHL